MPKKLIKKYMPDHKTIKEHKHLKIFGSLIHDPNLWHMNRRSVSGAFAVGFFCAFVPIPFQMVLAAAIAIVVRVNLPISVALVWISNPITMPPMFYAAYKLGAMVMGQVPSQVKFVLSWEWISTEMSLIWQPFLLGCFIFGVVCSIAGYFGIRLLWRLHIVKAWQERKNKKQLHASDNH